MTTVARQRGPTELCIRVTDETLGILDEIRRLSGLATNAEVIRAALGLLHHLELRRAQGYRVLLGSAGGQIARELSFGARP
ncbi:hypothetical protein HKCCE3408_02535 [Rhodobacterales bacterium HKCCE3408]|nr:hypothetical protein [Rhodobacterales bacterium HKCCE3408]